MTDVLEECVYSFPEVSANERSKIQSVTQVVMRLTERQQKLKSD